MGHLQTTHGAASLVDRAATADRPHPHPPQPAPNGLHNETTRQRGENHGPDPSVDASYLHNNHVNTEPDQPHVGGMWVICVMD